MKILGVSDAHNAAACLLADGQVVAGIQEERLSRVKNDHRFPTRAIEWVLDECALRPDDVDVVAVSSRFVHRPFTTQQLTEWMARPRTLGVRARAIARHTPAMTVRRRRRMRERVSEAVAVGFRADQVRFIDHHTCHARTAYHGSPWKDGPVLVMTADGEGDGVAGSVRIGRDGDLHPPLATVRQEDSLGAVYTILTHLLGMTPLEHEYKVMGLAPYAPDAGAQRSYRELAGMLKFGGPLGLSWRRARGWPDLFQSRDELERRLRFHRFDGIAAGLQQFFEEHLVEWVRRAVRTTGISRVALSGGLFMNVKANQAIAALDEVDQLFVFPSCGDETNAVGAAYDVEAGGRAATAGEAIEAIGSLYWGPDVDVAAVAPRLDDLRRAGYRVVQEEDIEDAVADLLAHGEVVARAKGRMEFGARALGNRSILADPSRLDVVKIINEMIKQRDFWMPFAPAILAEESEKYLVNPKRIPAPYMIVSFDTTDRAEEMRAAIHPYDLTARPQVVTQEQNPDLHRLIRGFQARTGRAAVLNTSFNLHGSPIVCSADDALDVLERSGLCHLALGDHLVSKPGTYPRTADG